MSQVDQYGIPDWQIQGAPQPQRNTQANPILGSLVKGFAMRQGRSGGSNMRDTMAAALKKHFDPNAGTGVTDTGGGVLGAAEQAGTGMGLVSQAVPAEGGLDAISSGGLAGGVTSGANGAGGFMTDTGRAVDTGFGDTGLGGGLRASDAGPGMQVSDANSIQYSAASDGGTGEAMTGGTPADDGGSMVGAVTGAYAGANQGVNNYWNDPNMRNKKDGFGEHHPDYRATIGGGTLGGVLGYYGGAVGSAIAPAVVQWVHPAMERLTRTMINAGDDMGDSAGAMVADPIGTMASGKYSDKQLVEDKIKYSLLGGLAKYIK